MRRMHNYHVLALQCSPCIIILPSSIGRREQPVAIRSPPRPPPLRPPAPPRARPSAPAHFPRSCPVFGKISSLSTRPSCYAIRSNRIGTIPVVQEQQIFNKAKLDIEMPHFPPAGSVNAPLSARLVWNLGSLPQRLSYILSVYNLEGSTMRTTNGS